MNFSQYDVVIVPFPYTDRTKARPRPAIIVSSDEANKVSNVAILAMITRIDAQPWYKDQPLEDPGSAGLERPCKARMKLFSIDLSSIKKRTGSLGQKDRENVTSVLRDVFNL